MQSKPAPFLCRGLIDTGTDITAISAGLVAQLGVSPVVQATTNTAAGSTAVDLCDVSLNITDVRLPNAAWLTIPVLRVMMLSATLPTVDVLIGLDVLLDCTLRLDGPKKQFTLEF